MQYKLIFFSLLLLLFVNVCGQSNKKDIQSYVLAFDKKKDSINWTGENFLEQHISQNFDIKRAIRIMSCLELHLKDSTFKFIIGFPSLLENKNNFSTGYFKIVGDTLTLNYYKINTKEFRFHTSYDSSVPIDTL